MIQREVWGYCLGSVESVTVLRQPPQHSGHRKKALSRLPFAYRGKGDSAFMGRAFRTPDVQDVEIDRNYTLQLIPNK